MKDIMRESILLISSGNTWESEYRIWRLFVLGFLAVKAGSFEGIGTWMSAFKSIRSARDGILGLSFPEPTLEIHDTLSESLKLHEDITPCLFVLSSDCPSQG